MRSIVFGILFFTLLVISISGQTEKLISAIRADVNLINKSAAKYDKKTKSVDSISLEGAEATYFTSGRGLKKITQRCMARPSGRPPSCIIQAKS